MEKIVRRDLHQVGFNKAQHDPMENLVPYNIAKKLEMVGFDWECFFIVQQQKDLEGHSTLLYSPAHILFDDTKTITKELAELYTTITDVQAYLAPTVFKVNTWLMQNHHLYIDVQLSYSNEPHKCGKYQYRILNTKTNSITPYSGSYYNHTYIYELGIDKALNQIIKKSNESVSPH